MIKKLGAKSFQHCLNAFYDVANSCWITKKVNHLQLRNLSIFIKSVFELCNNKTNKQTFNARLFSCCFNVVCCQLVVWFSIRTQS